MARELPVLTSKAQIDAFLWNTVDAVLVLRFGRAHDPHCMQLDDVLARAAVDVSRFARIALVDAEAGGAAVYVEYLDVRVMPACVFFFNATHIKMDAGTADHSKWVGPFASKQDFIDVVETIYRGAMRGKLIVTCPLPRDRIPHYELLYHSF
ncbi:hypothetical protein CLOM_g23360 [Closterium sp. NIES-68]|nr:hypothetical protein CLOM_g23360 [Closterium sp. NIES-68]GJP71585.1 hypothetical protein CLOP_g2406 [Closterium sp. NIES-67]